MQTIRRLALLSALLVLTGCGAKGYHLATVSVTSAHATASVVQDTADAFVCGAATAPAAPQCLDTAQRRAIAEKLSPAFGLTGRIASEVKAWPPNAPLPASIPALLAQVTQLINDVLALLPASAQQRITALVGGAK